MLSVAHWIAAGNITMAEQFGPLHTINHLLLPHRYQHQLLTVQHDVIPVGQLAWVVYGPLVHVALHHALPALRLYNSVGLC